MKKAELLKETRKRRRKMAKVQNRKRFKTKFTNKTVGTVSRILEGKKYGVEHALDMHASSYVVMPAEAIYEKDLLKEYQSVIDTCHIYIIGYLPKIDFVGAAQIGNDLELSFLIANQKRVLRFGPIPDGVTFKVDDGYHFMEDSNGSRFWWDDDKLMHMLNQQPPNLHFEVKYVGQAYGQDGSRNALDRLIKHETLQKIAVKGVPEGYKLSLLLLEIEPDNTLITAFTPNAQLQGTEGSRIKSGLEKLYGTTESERISLFEAAMIRYFSPEYNKEFKNSFPSTNLKILQDCYDKDISAVFAEICIDEIPFMLFSDAVEPKQYHFSKHDLHQEPDRKVFFCV